MRLLSLSSPSHLLVFAVATQCHHYCKTSSADAFSFRLINIKKSGFSRQPAALSMSSTRLSLLSKNTQNKDEVVISTANGGGNNSNSEESNRTDRSFCFCLLERHQVLKLLQLHGLSALLTTATRTISPAIAAELSGNDSFSTTASSPPVLVSPPKQIKQLYSEGLAKQTQGNILAAQRIFTQVTKLVPEFVYGWSNLGNTQVALGLLDEAEESYTKSIDLCKIQEEQLNSNTDTNVLFGTNKPCEDLYVLYLNRGTTRLVQNTNSSTQKALSDLELAAKLRRQPDAIVLQNRARGRELNGLYELADADYDLAISMSKDGVAPFWLRAALVKFQLNRITEALSLIRRVEQRFPEAPEVRAALAALYNAMGDTAGARQKFLEIPNVARLNYSNTTYVTQTIAWPPTALYHIAQVAKDSGDT